MSVSHDVQSPSPPPNGNTSRRTETRRRLLEAGTALFAAEGLHAVTSARIAQHAGVATGTFYLHFSDKHVLFEEIVSVALADLRSRQDSAAAGIQAPAEVLRVRLEELVRFTEENRELILVAFARGPESGPITQLIHDRVATDIEERLRRRVAAEGLAIHPGVAAQSRAATLIRVIAWWAEDPTRASREDVVETLLLLEPGRQASPKAPDGAL